ncbi:glycosyltransferase [Haladaptatus salinisoli]|uniref:glycosyltransferase n=1 Tax=Haladaptatus salinisoli TaxID=2884876 RepID=UPI001D0AB816|nr:glycosyltransferase [Haladaptatus salinisoli]
MSRTVAIAHYPEGAGHATRMLAVAQALEGPEIDIVIAGGGPGSQFIEYNGYEVYRPATVDYIGDYQGGSLFDVVTRSVPNSAKRVFDLARWLRRKDPDALVTDDMFAAMAAQCTGTPLYVLTHNAATYYDAAVEQGFTWLLNRYQLSVARAFLFPAVWPPDRGDPPGVVHIPPVALEPNGETAPDDVGVLVVPSTYSTNFAELARALRNEGHAVTLVGGDDWECASSLLPWIRAADAVVCSGYSTVMEAAVAGTPCIVYPFTDEQHGVSRVIERRGLRGFQVEHSIPHVARAVRHPPNPPSYENGAKRAAEVVMDTLQG